MAGSFMPAVDWTVDTWMLYQVAAVDGTVIHFLERAKTLGHKVVFDHEGRIRKEYDACMQKTAGLGGHDLLRKWFKEVVAKHMVVAKGSLPRRHRERLNALKFDPDDWPFVGACSNSIQRRLVIGTPGDSDYTNPVKEFITNTLKITVLSTEQALAHL